MIRKFLIILTIFILTAAFAFAQTAVPAQIVCRCAEGIPCCSCCEALAACCNNAAHEPGAPAARDSRTQAQAAEAESALPTRASRQQAGTAAESEPAARASRPINDDTAAESEPAARASRTTEETAPAARANRNEETEPAARASRNTEPVARANRNEEPAARANRNEQPAEEDISSHIPENILYNEYYTKSVELSQQAQEAYDNGFYDGSIALAEESIYYAHLSDAYVTEQLIAEAKRLMDWADNNGIETRYPNLYHASKEYYEASLEAQENSELTEANIAAIKAIEILGPMEAGRPSHLPRQYTVRSWAHEKDCLWNIAGYPFVYGDPWKWRLLYDANKARMPQPNNPNIIEPGFVLDIPNLPGENRSGMWSPHQ